MNLPAFSKTYDGVKVLDFPGLTLQPGKIYAILGANGSGKSTFARIAAGILPADRKCRISGSVGYLDRRNRRKRQQTDDRTFSDRSEGEAG